MQRGRGWKMNCVSDPFESLDLNRAQARSVREIVIIYSSGVRVTTGCRCWLREQRGARSIGHEMTHRDSDDAAAQRLGVATTSFPFYHYRL